MAPKSRSTKQKIATAKNIAVQEAVDNYGKVADRLKSSWSAVLEGGTIEDDERLEMNRRRERTKSISSEIGVSARRATRISALKERVIGGKDYLGLDYFARGMVAARSVGRIDGFEGWQGTGFLVSPELVMTNHHVLRTTQAAEGAHIGFELPNADNRFPDTASCTFDPDRFWWTSPELDVTIVALKDSPRCRALTEQLGWHPIISQQGKIILGDPVAIIQYPRGGQKSVVVHNSTFLYLENGGDIDSYCWYTSDTEPGSSGSPVFNRHWEVVAVHHQSLPKVNANGEIVDRAGKPIPEETFLEKPELAVWIANQGIRASRIVKGLAAHDFTGREDHDAIRDGLLNLWEAASPRNTGQEEPLRAMMLRMGAELGAAPPKARESEAAAPARINGASAALAESAGPEDWPQRMARLLQTGERTVNFNFIIGSDRGTQPE